MQSFVATTKGLLFFEIYKRSLACRECGTLLQYMLPTMVHSQAFCIIPLIKVLHLAVTMVRDSIYTFVVLDLQQQIITHIQKHWQVKLTKHEACLKLNFLYHWRPMVYQPRCLGAIGGPTIFSPQISISIQYFKIITIKKIVDEFNDSFIQNSFVNYHIHIE